MGRFVLGMQISFPLELVDEGLEQSLDNMKKRGFNSIFLLSNMDHQSSSYWGKLGHNPKRSEIVSSGLFYEPHAKYYETTKIRPAKTRDPVLNRIDIFGEVTKAAHERGMKSYPFVVNRLPWSDGYLDCCVTDVLDRRVPKVLCLNNVNVRNFYYGMLTDLTENYELDGVFIALLDHSVQFGFTKLPDELVEITGTPQLNEPELGLTCFCEDCKKLAHSKGVDPERIKQGLVRGVKTGWLPDKIQNLSTVDETMRLLMDVPEYLEWLRFRAECLSDFHRELYRLVKSIKPKAEVTLDIYGPTDCWKYASDFRSLTKNCEWVKPMFYSGTYPAPPATPERIYLETKKAILEAAPGVDVVAGINAVSQPPEYVKESVRQCLRAGSKGAMISWDYGLIPFENMDAAADAVSESGR